MTKDAWKSAGAGAALVILLTVAVYLPVRNAGFVYDDHNNVTANESLRTVTGLKRIWVDPRASYQYYPLTYTSFWVDYHLWGLDPAGYHVVNVLLHALNAVLVGLLLSRLAVPGAWFGALLFALHPVHVESVAWVSERKNVLSGLFYLSSLLVYLRFQEVPKRRWRFYALSYALFVCALLSKTSAASMPFAVLLVLWWKRGRIKWQDVVSLIPFFLVGAVLGLLTAWVEVHYSGARGPEWQLSWLDRCLVAGRVVWFYAGKLIWPDPLMIIYPRWQIDSAVWWQYLFPCAAGAVVLALWWWRERLGKAPLVAVVFFVGSLVPVPALINIAFMRYSYVADHWQYLSSIALIALAAATGERLWRRMGQQRRWFGAVAGVAVLAGLAVATWKQSYVYADEETLWRDNVAKNPDAWGAHNNLGFALHARGRLGDAVGEYEQALRLMPDYAEAHYNLGVALYQAGNVKLAMEHYEQALRLKSNFAAVYNNLGTALLGLGRVQEAIERYEQAVRLGPDNADAHYNLGIALAKAGRVEEAMGHWEQALRIKPDYAEAHGNLGRALAQAGQTHEAIEQDEQALILKPDYPEAQNHLAWLLATLTPAEGGDPVRAVTLAQQTCAMTGNQTAVYLDTLAVAYAAAGRFADAIATARKAVELAYSAGQPRLAATINARLESYRSGRAYHPTIDTTRSGRP